jgi:hypothetical protein
LSAAWQEAEIPLGLACLFTWLSLCNSRSPAKPIDLCSRPRLRSWIDAFEDLARAKSVGTGTENLAPLSAGTSTPPALFTKAAKALAKASAPAVQQYAFARECLTRGCEQACQWLMERHLSPQVQYDTMQRLVNCFEAAQKFCPNATPCPDEPSRVAMPCNEALANVLALVCKRVLGTLEVPRRDPYKLERPQKIPRLTEAPSIEDLLRKFAQQIYLASPYAFENVCSALHAVDMNGTDCRLLLSQLLKLTKRPYGVVPQCLWDP